MATFSTRMGLTKPAGSEPRQVTAINNNSDLLDKFMPCILVNDGVTPPTGDLYDGALVKERNSGIVWEARKNGGGTYDKVYVVYPWQLTAYTAAGGVPSSTAYANYGFTTWFAGKNSSQSNIVGSNWVAVPIKGIYEWHINLQYASNATGYRSGCPLFNGAPDFNNDEVNLIAANIGSSPTNVHCVGNKPLAANDQVGVCYRQNSGSTINMYASIYITLISPLQ